MARQPEVPKGPLLYCFPRNSTFIQRDVEALGSRFSVRPFDLKAGPAWALPFRLAAQLFWLLRNKSWARDCICHFSGYHALLPALLCRRNFIILAGNDCASIPAIRYGNHARKLMGWATRMAAARSTALLPVDESLMIRSQGYSGMVPEAQGLLAFAPEVHTPWRAVPYGFDARSWTPGPPAVRDPASFICVPGAAAPGNRVHWLKGIDLVLAIAARVPQARFTIVGLQDPRAYKQLPPNVRTVGRLAPSALREAYQRASFILQLSLSEGMPNALCEAMLCGCIPMVSAVASMPGIVQQTGLVLARHDPSMAAELCTTLLGLSPAERTLRADAARARIAHSFTMERRMEGIYSVMRTFGPRERR